MSVDFYRNQNPGERVTKLNALSDRVCQIADQVAELAEAGVSGGTPTSAYDPGDLSVYYENGKA